MPTKKTSFRTVNEFLLKKLRWVIVGIGLILFAVLWLAARGNPSSATGSLSINLAASALTVSFTAFLIDWLQERRQRLLVAKPLAAARHELGSVCFLLGTLLGQPYLTTKFPQILKESIENKPPTMEVLAELRKNLIAELGTITPDNCPHTTPELAATLTNQIGSQITSIDEVWRLYGFALDSDLRDAVFLLRDRLVSLRNTLSVFGLGGGVQNTTEMQKLVALEIQSLIEAVKALDVEWAQVKDSK